MKEDFGLLLIRETFGDIAKAGIQYARVYDVLGRRRGQHGERRCRAGEVPRRLMVWMGVRVLGSHCFSLAPP